MPFLPVPPYLLPSLHCHLYQGKSSQQGRDIQGGHAPPAFGSRCNPPSSHPCYVTGPWTLSQSVHNLPWGAALFPSGRHGYYFAIVMQCILNADSLYHSLFPSPSQGLWRICSAPCYTMMIISHEEFLQSCFPIELPKENAQNLPATWQPSPLSLWAGEIQPLGRRRWSFYSVEILVGVIVVRAHILTCHLMCRAPRTKSPIHARWWGKRQGGGGSWGGRSGGLWIVVRTFSSANSFGIPA